MSEFHVPDDRLNELIKNIKPLIFKNDKIYSFIIPDLRNVAYTWEPKGLKKVKKEYKVVAIGTTVHSCGYYGFFKPSIEEAFYHLPDEYENINAFYIDTDSVEVINGGNNHSAKCYWLEWVK